MENEKDKEGGEQGEGHGDRRKQGEEGRGEKGIAVIHYLRVLIHQTRALSTRPHLALIIS